MEPPVTEPRCALVRRRCSIPSRARKLRCQRTAALRGWEGRTSTEYSSTGASLQLAKPCPGAKPVNGADIRRNHIFNSPSSVKALQTATAVIELGAGLALLCCPSATVVLLVAAPLEIPTALTVVRVGGAGLFALGVACWLARGDTQSRAARGLVAATLFYNVATVVLLAFANLGNGLHGVALWPAVFLHAAMALWCAACLFAIP